MGKAAGIPMNNFQDQTLVIIGTDGAVLIAEGMVKTDHFRLGAETDFLGVEPESIAQIGINFDAQMVGRNSWPGGLKFHVYDCQFSRQSFPGT